MKKTEDNKSGSVRIKLFRDNGNYRDDVFVSVNGENFTLKRGEEISVPVYVAEVLENSARQDSYTTALIERLEGEYAGSAQAMRR